METNLTHAEPADDAGPQILFDDPKRTALLLRAHLITTLYELQGVIMRVERFGNAAVHYPNMQSRLDDGIGVLAETIRKLNQRHDERAAQIRTLTVAIDKATEADSSPLSIRSTAATEPRPRSKGAQQMNGRPDWTYQHARRRARRVANRNLYAFRRRRATGKSARSNRRHLAPRIARPARTNGSCIAIAVAL